jgi:uncharacterized protein
MGTEAPPDQGPSTPKEELSIAARNGGGSAAVLGIRADGSWTYQGSAIRRQALVKLFATVLRREPDGYWLVTPVERARVEVEDAPFTAVELVAEGEGADQSLRLRTNLDAWLTVDADHPLEMRRPRLASGAEDEAAPYVLVRPGLEARLLRPVYYQLVELGLEQEIEGVTRFGVWSGGRFFALDRVPE